jgi:hypothetical protein
MESLFPQGLLHYAFGGVLIGLGVSLLFVATGLVGGASSFFSSTLSWFSKTPGLQEDRYVASRTWRLAYAAGFVLGAFAFSLVAPGALVLTQVPAWQLALGGLLAGFGARLSNGCTSGHGICGLASLQVPSLLAVITFLATAIATANLVGMLR